MDLKTLIPRMEALRKKLNRWPRSTRVLWRRLALFMAVVGPGFITSNVDNDAGGISTYSIAGAKYGYALLWSLIPMTIALYVTEEMCARLGVVTGKGLSDLIREEFGFRPTFFVMVTGFLVDLMNVVAEFAGVAAAMEIFRISKYIAVPVAAIMVWILVMRGTARQVEKIFLDRLSILRGLYRFSRAREARLASRRKKSHRSQLPIQHALSSNVDRSHRNHHRAVAVLLLASGFRRKARRASQYPQARADVLVGSISCMVIVFFIIVCTAATLFVSGHHDIKDAKEAAQALLPMAGRWASLLFAFGLLNASLFAASILPLSTAHVICEGLGFEAGIDHKFREAPIFYWLYTVLIVVGAGLILLPGAPLLKILFFSQVGNGIWLPIVLIFIVLLSSRKDLMGTYANSTLFSVIAWTTSIIMIALTLVLIYASFFLGGVPGL